jgi:Resolvase, N terminal domain
MAACRAGDTLVVTKLDRLARSLPNARAILEELTAGHVAGTKGRSPTTPKTASRKGFPVGVSCCRYGRFMTARLVC